jgi:preprotein translocase subunit SecB
MTNGNPPQEVRLFQFNVLTQYIKNLSFESPNAPQSLEPQAERPQINLQINVAAGKIEGRENDYEVMLNIQGKAEKADQLFFRFALVYGGVFRVIDAPKESLHPLIMIECPRMLFPFAREVIASCVRGGGFPQLGLDPVDFVALYQRNLQMQAAAAKQS